MDVYLRSSSWRGAKAHRSLKQKGGGVLVTDITEDNSSVVVGRLFNDAVLNAEAI
jgi:hypothetical protein